ncbi:MAG: radical SAM protein [Nitrospinota bacterium]|nr:radical SAM protein [Nitrospinota bacterium]
MLTVNEIFKSIQGESTHTGRPCIFIRLTGCNLRCSWCDTEYAFYEGMPKSVQDIMDAIGPLGVPLVEITGGEPLLQEEVYDLMNALLAKNYEVLLETGGGVSVARVPNRVIKILDVKCPGSGEVSKNLWENLDLLHPHDEVKFVLKDRADYEWSRDILRRHDLPEKATVLFSSVYDSLDLKQLARWVLEDNLPVRVQTQLHKVIWGKDAIGV